MSEVQRLQEQAIPLNNSAVDLMAVVKDRVQMCLSATGMKEYFQQNGLLEDALTSAANYVARIRRLVPERFLTAFSSHCWAVNITVQVDRSSTGSLTIHGKYGTISYQGNLTNTHVRPYNPSNGADFLSVACIPEVFLAGFAKCGSTYLYSLLHQHPLIIKSRSKEPHWWLFANHFTDNTSGNALFLAEYLLTYKSLVEEMQKQNTFGLLSVDATPSKMYRWPHFDKDKNLKVNYCLLPAVIPKVLPRAKFLVVMRNPTDLLYSSFWFSCTRRGGNVAKDEQLKGPNIFHERVVKKISTFKICIERFPLVKCVLDSTRNSFSLELPCGKIRLDMSLYYVHVHKWLSVVPQSKFLFLTLEELSADADGTMSEVWNFLGLPYTVLQPAEMSSWNQQERIDYHHNPQLFMREDTRELLNKFFAPYNQMLADLLGDDKFQWTT